MLYIQASAPGIAAKILFVPKGKKIEAKSPVPLPERMQAAGAQKKLLYA
jgi:hypothetical protein